MPTVAEQLVGFFSTSPRVDPTKARDEAIALSESPEPRRNLEQWALAQLIATGLPFFACEMAGYIGKPRTPWAFSPVIRKASRNGTIKAIGYGRQPNSPKRPFCTIWIGSGVSPVTEAMFDHPRFKSAIRVPVGAGLSAADVQNEFTAEDLIGLSDLGYRDAAKEAVSRLARNRSYFSSETVKAMFAQSGHELSKGRYLGGVFLCAIRTGAIEKSGVLASADPARRRGKVLVYRGVSQ